MKSDMGVERYTFDTNVLFYSIDSLELTKHKIARNLIGLANASRTPILLQTLGELCNSVTRRRPSLLPQANDLLSASAEFYEVVSATSSDMHEALNIQQRHSLQFWDALICATARRAGCTLLLSEDMHDGLRLGALTVRNPFTMSESELEELPG